MIDSIDNQVFHQNLAPKSDANAGKADDHQNHRQLSVPGISSLAGRHASPVVQIRDQSRQKLSYSGTAFGFTNPMKTVTYRTNHDGTILASIADIKRGRWQSRQTGARVPIIKRYPDGRVDLRV
jgi:hypothetical protein